MKIQFVACLIACLPPRRWRHSRGRIGGEGPPTVDQILSIKRAGSPEISPDGRGRLYGSRDNWDDNAYETEIWVATRRAAPPAPATDQRKKSSLSPSWSPDGSKLAFVSDARTSGRSTYQSAAVKRTR